MQALGLDVTFFIQFFILLLVYPIISRGLLRPYVNLQYQREQQTKGRHDAAQALEETNKKLRMEYEQKAYNFHKKFRTLYQEKSKQLQLQLFKESQIRQANIRKKFMQKQSLLDQEVEEIQKQMPSEEDKLVKVAMQVFTKG